MGDERLEGYLEALQNVDTGRLVKAIKALTTTEEFFPRPSKIIKKAYTFPQPKAAWEIENEKFLMEGNNDG